MSEESRTLDEMLDGFPGARLLSRTEAMKARACLALDCLTRLKLVLTDEMDDLRIQVRVVASDGMALEVFNEAVEGFERRMKACVFNAVYAARAVASPLMHEIPGALPGDGKEVDA